MKKKILIASLALGMLVTAGCERYENGEMLGKGTYKVIGQRGYDDILRDTETGCLYLLNINSRDKQPFYGEDGEVQGCGQKDMDENKYN